MKAAPQIIDLSNALDTLNSIYKTRFSAWGDRLSLDQFLEREQLLMKSDWYRSGVKTWGLMTDNAVLASCETLPIQIKQNGQTLRGCIIASVLVEEMFRNRGYASQLVSEVTQRSLSKLDFVCLFSEVGTNIYERCGFGAQSVQKLTIQVKSQHKASNIIKHLTQSECLEHAKSSTTNMNTATLLASPEQLTWKWLRCSFYAKATERIMSDVLGLSDGYSLLVLAPDFKTDTLKILHASRSPQTDTRNWLELWKAAESIATQNQFSSIIAWIPRRLSKDINELKSSFSIVLNEDQEDIPMFCSKQAISSNLDIEYISWA